MLFLYPCTQIVEVGEGPPQEERRRAVSKCCGLKGFHMLKAQEDWGQSKWGAMHDGERPNHSKLSPPQKKTLPPPAPP